MPMEVLLGTSQNRRIYHAYDKYHVYGGTCRYYLTLSHSQCLWRYFWVLLRTDVFTMHIKALVGTTQNSRLYHEYRGTCRYYQNSRISHVGTCRHSSKQSHLPSCIQRNLQVLLKTVAGTMDMKMRQYWPLLLLILVETAFGIRN